MTENRAKTCSMPPESASKPIQTAYQHELQALDLAFLGSLVPGIIHNFATPLSGVLGAIQLMEKRIAAIEQALRNLQTLDDGDRQDLNSMWEKHRSNVDILARNAKHLADMMQIIVRRISRSNSNVEEMLSLNDLIHNELRFLEANLSFKHKVKKNVALGPNVSAACCVYAHVVSAIDEFVIGTMALHDMSKGVMEMNFSSDVSDGEVALLLDARFSPHPEPHVVADALESYLQRLRGEGWSIALNHGPGCRSVRLAYPRRVAAA